MRRETLIVEIEYKVFEPGEKVRPTSSRAYLEDDIYTVTRCHPPSQHHPEGGTFVYLEGREYGFDGYYLLPADDPCFTCDGCGNYKPTGRKMFGICPICQPTC